VGVKPSCDLLQVTPLHYDPPHCNLLAQVMGRKYVRLYPPSATPLLAPYESGHHSNSSQVDISLTSGFQKTAVFKCMLCQAVSPNEQLRDSPIKSWRLKGGNPRFLTSTA